MRGASDILDKFKGTLIGCAVGDALGAPMEGMPAETIAQKYGRVADFIDERFGVGAITDDTQMTIALAQSIVDYGRFEARHAAFKFGRWMEFSDRGIKEARDPGMASAAACRSIYKGASHDESGVQSAGCGAAMRVSPLGLRYYGDPDALKQSSVEQARITHTDPEALAGSAAVAFAVAWGIGDEGNFDRVTLINECAAFISSINATMAARISGLADYLDATPEEGFAFTGNGGYVMETVPGALFAFLRSPYDFEETVITAVNAGGDTDSLGAIAGAISGSFNGLEGIPGRWKDNVEGGEYIEGLATKLYTLTPAFKQTSRPLF